MTQAKERNLGKNLVSGTGLLVLVIIIILLNVLFAKASWRWDATEEKAYSLSEGTLEVITGLKHPVTIKLFYTASQTKLPVYLKTYATRVEELLDEYQLKSNGMVRFDLCDPKPDSKEEEWADIYGMEAKSLQTGEKVYFGLIAYSRDKEEIIPFLDYSRDQVLEYDLTQTITQLTTEEKKTIGVLSTLPVMGQSQVPGMPQMPGAQDKPWFFVTELKKNFNVVEVSPLATAIDGGIDLLMVLHPKMLRPETLYSIDRFITKGNNAIFLVDPVCTADQSSSRGKGINYSSMEPLFKAWGISVDPQKVAVDLGQQTQVRNRFNVVEHDPSWITVREAYLNREDPVTSNLEEMLFPMAGAIRTLDDFAMEFTPLVVTSPDSGLINSFDATLGARTIKQDFESGGKSMALAARIRGVFPTAFPDGPPEEVKNLVGEENLPLGDNPLNKKSTVLVIADVDFIVDDICMMAMRTPFGFAMSMPRNDNMVMFINGTEMLTGSNALISIRSRGKTERPFTKVLDLKSKAQSRWLAKEKELMERAETAQKKLTELENQKDADQRFIMSPEQREAIDNFKEEQREVEQELKEVRKNLRSDIVSLGWFLKFVNVLLMPLLVALVGIGFAIYRHKRMKKA
ncbi:MAG: Gldg family protein [Desulfatibacillum sp.]|nr:Gldg family protein [Desulfatibacillum sp.]